MIVKYYNKDKLCSVIFADEKGKSVTVENHTDNPIERAFGINEEPTWNDFLWFMEERCFPRDRQNVKYELKKLGLDEYDPLKICRATNGRNYDDAQWMEFIGEPEEELEYDDCERN